MPGSALAALSLLLLSAPLFPTEGCGWLPTRDVDAALPELAPWGVMHGGAAGECTFVSMSGPPHLFGARQRVEASAQEAASVVRGMREETAASYEVVAAKGLGAEAYTYRPKGELSDRMIFFVAREGRVVVEATLSLQVPVGPGHIEGATRLVRAAAAIDRDRVALAALTSCPWFNTDVLKKLLPGEGFRQQSLGSEACLAMAGGSDVQLIAVEVPGEPGHQAELFARMFGGGCSHEPIALLGPLSEIRWACQRDREGAMVRYISGNRLIMYIFSPGREPTAAERGLLIELATSAPARGN